MSGMKIIEGLQEAVAHSRGDLSLRGIIEAIFNVDSQEPTDYRRLAGRIAARMSGEIDRLTRDLAETRAERDAARAVPEELRQFSEVAHKGRLVFSDIYDQRFARAAATWVRALIAALGSATPPATPTASVQAGERMHHNQFATDLVRAEALAAARDEGLRAKGGGGGET